MTQRFAFFFFTQWAASLLSLHTTSLHVFDNHTCGQTVLVTADSRFHRGETLLTRSQYWSQHALKTLFLLLFQFCLNSVCVAHWFLDIVCIGSYSETICKWTPVRHSQQFSLAKESRGKSFFEIPFHFVKSPTWLHVLLHNNPSSTTLAE